MAHRITEAANTSRVGSRIREALTRAINHLKQQKSIQVKGDFLWNPEVPIPAIRNRSSLSNGSRKLKYISPEEIVIAIRHIVDESLAISGEEAAALVVRLFGFNRLTEEMQAEINPIINKAVHNKIIRFDAGFYKPVE